jgi:hypothetical protein
LDTSRDQPSAVLLCLLARVGGQRTILELRRRHKPIHKKVKEAASLGSPSRLWSPRLTGARDGGENIGMVRQTRKVRVQDAKKTITRRALLSIIKRCQTAHIGARNAGYAMEPAADLQSRGDNALELGIARGAPKDTHPFSMSVRYERYPKLLSAQIGRSDDDAV